MIPPETEYREFLELLGCIREGTIQSDQKLRLNDLLEKYPSLRQDYVDYVLLCATLRAHRTLSQEACHAFSEADAIPAHDVVPDLPLPMPQEPVGDAHDPTPNPRVEAIKLRAEQRLNEYLAELEALRRRQALAAQRTWPKSDWSEWARKGRRFVRIMAKSAAAVAALALICLGVADYIRAHRVVARVDSEVHTRWSHAVDGNALHPGSLTLDQGCARIVFVNGAEVLVQAPCEFRLDSASEMALDRGKITVRLLPPARRFKVQTPSAQVVDFGTEFGVAVDGMRQSQIHVFDGEVGIGPGNNALRHFKQGQVAWVDSLGQITEQHGTDQSCLFVRHMPEPNQLSMPGRQLDLTDVVGGGSGFGTSLPGRGIDPVDGTLTSSYGYPGPRFSSGYSAVHSLPLVDGVFIPDVGVEISSTHLTFPDCRDTDGASEVAIMNDARFVQLGTNEAYPGVLGGRTYGTPDHPAMVLHPNAGITFDLAQIRMAMPGVRIRRFRSLCGISETTPWRSAADFWVLINGRVVYSLRDTTPASPPGEIDVELTDQDQFLTLATTVAHDKPRSGAWSMFAEPLLELEPAGL